MAMWLMSRAKLPNAPDIRASTPFTQLSLPWQPDTLASKPDSVLLSW